MTVQARFAAYRDAETVLRGRTHGNGDGRRHVADDEIDSYRQEADKMKMVSYAALDAVEETMRDELASL